MLDFDSFYAGFGTLRFDLKHSEIISLFKSDKTLQAIIDTIVQEGNEDELCREADLYLLDSNKLDNHMSFDIGFSFAEFIDRIFNKSEIFAFDMITETYHKIGKLYFVGSRDSVKKRLELLY